MSPLIYSSIRIVLRTLMYKISHFISRQTIFLFTLFSLSFTQLLAINSAQATALNNATDNINKAKTVTFIRDYTYNASENDSKVSARRAALEQLQKAAIEEVGIHIQSSVVNHETVTQGELKREMQLNFKTFSQALTKTKILEEKWNGETFYIKAEIEVDPNGITTAMNNLQSGKTPEEICADNAAKVRALLQNPANIERNQALVDIAITTKFDEDCNRWQYGILSSLTRYEEYPTKGYRKFIFSQLTTVKSYQIVNLIPKVIGYAISHGGKVSKGEWAITLQAMQRMPTNKFHGIVRALTRLDMMEYEKKIKDIIQLAEDNKLGYPATTKENAIQTIIKISLGKSKEYTGQLYLKYADDLTDVNKLAPIVSKIFEWSYKQDDNASEITEVESQALADEVINHFFDNNDIERFSENAKRSLYEIMRPLINASRHPEYNADEDISNQYIKDLLKRYPNEFAYLVESHPISVSSKNLFLLQNNLPAANLCLPKACAKQVFNRELTSPQQNVYLDYLEAYGNRANVVEKDMIKLFDRSRAMPSSVNRTHRKTVLITILANIKTTNTKAIDLMINSLKDFDHKVPDTAINALGSIGMPAFERIKVFFAESEDLSKRRMIEAIGQMPPTKDMITFLKSIPTPSNLPMKFAIEDAIERHESAQ